MDLVLEKLQNSGLNDRVKLFCQMNKEVNIVIIFLIFQGVTVCKYTCNDRGARHHVSLKSS